MPFGRLWLPDWAPNLHPVLVHFPIALLVTAVVVDVLAVFSRDASFTRRATGFYALGTTCLTVTYLSGRDAAATVFTPGMAHAVVQDHWAWGMWTTLYFVALTAARLLVKGRLLQGDRAVRGVFLIAGTCGVVLLTMTAERGARLVYQYGVGVAGVP
jgi:uncharacterized membrane protein